jgi:hypothetical protein
VAAHPLQAGVPIRPGALHPVVSTGWGAILKGSSHKLGGVSAHGPLPRANPASGTPKVMRCVT